MFRCDRRCYGNFGNFVGTKHTPGRTEPIASARHHQFTCGRPALPPASSWTRGRSQSLGAGRPTKAISYLCLYNRTPTMSFRTRFSLPVRLPYDKIENHSCWFDFYGVRIGPEDGRRHSSSSWVSGHVFLAGGHLVPLWSRQWYVRS